MVTSDQVPADQDQWQRALRRTRARAYELEFVKDVWMRGYQTYVWRVASSSDAGAFHYVVLTRMCNRWSVECDCRAGERGIPCVHSALALREQGILDNPDQLMVT